MKNLFSSKLLGGLMLAIVFLIGLSALSMNKPKSTHSTVCSWPSTGSTVSTDQGHTVTIKDRWTTEICPKNKGIMANWVFSGTPVSWSMHFSSYYSGSGPICQEDYDACFFETFYNGSSIKTQSYEYKWGYCPTDGYVLVMLESDDCSGGYTEVIFSDGIPYENPEQISITSLQGETGKIKIGSYTYSVTSTYPSGGWCYDQTYNTPCPGTIPQ